jgi:hypothetical protein
MEENKIESEANIRKYETICDEKIDMCKKEVKYNYVGI